MLLSEFSYDLPERLIAQSPLAERSASRLLVLGKNDTQPGDKYFVDFADLLRPEDLLVFNNTRVVPARLFGKRETGGKVEILIERLINPTQVLARMRFSRAPKPGSYLFVEEVPIRVLARDNDLFELEIENTTFPELMEQAGHMPLPPYIRRDDNQEDRERYQTVYSETPGAVAAPTAGLHFDEAMLKRIKEIGVDTASVTLHVGAGTFLPVRVDNIEDHKMHKEWLEVNQLVCDQIVETKTRGGRVIAVGTTSVRSLETAAVGGEIQPYSGDTDIFITPGYRFNVVDALLTNFHLPESTLLMLVSAFSGKERIMQAYQHAIEQEYRFFSYGDAMFLEKLEG